MALLAEGVAPALIENAGLQAGMPVGPLALTDEVSAELVVKIDKQTQADLGDAYRERPGQSVARKMVELGRIGKKAGLGFYDYPEGGKKSLWPGLSVTFPLAATQPPLAELVQRLLFVQSLEAARCMEEGVLTAARDADVGSVLGWGFPAYLGGTIGQIQGLGVKAFAAQCEQLAGRHGERFAPPQLLRDMAGRGDEFYPR
jgi:3-hydroxyacyl-CoA dehydrogenase/enoyl-CoA hydratase/3-hydroxybutyryl-CoA epimerase